MAEHNILGKKGEEKAAMFLLENGYNIVARNWRYKRIEIDIIATNNEFILFVEVKTRSSSFWGNPEDSIDASRIKRMVEAADYYVQEYDVSLPVRFDVLSIVQHNDSVEIEHIDDAFMAPLD